MFGGSQCRCFLPTLASSWCGLRTHMLVRTIVVCSPLRVAWFFSVFGLCLRVWMRGRFVRDAYLEAEGGEHGVSQRPTRCNVHRTTGADVFLRGPEILQEDHHCEMPSHGIVPALVNPLRCVHHPTTTSRHEDSCTTTFWRSRHRLILVNRTSVRGATWQVVGKRDEFAFLATERCSWTRVSFKQ